MQYFLPVFFGLMVLFIAILFGNLMRELPDDFVAFPIIMMTALSLILIVETAIGWYFLYRLTGVVVSIDEQGVVYRYRGGVKHLRFETLRVESSSIRYTGGWMKLVSGKDVIRLTVVLEDIGEFIQELKSALDNRGLSSHYDPQKLFAFMKTAVAADQSWERVYGIFEKLFLIIFVVGITIANGFILGTTLFGSLAICWGSFSIFWIMGAYIFAEIILMRKIAKESNEQAFSFPPRDLGYERHVFNKAVSWGGWLYFLISLLTLVFALVAKNVISSF